MGEDIRQGDALELLRAMPDESVQAIVTSPPYWGLRDYGTAQWDGGDPACDHVQPVSFKRSTLGASTGGRSEETHARSVGAQASPYRDACGKCGARRVDRQLGLEPTLAEYVAKMREVGEELRRVLRRNGSLWLNLGDCYAGSWGAQSRGDDYPGTLEGGSTMYARSIAAHPKGTHTGSAKRTGLKPKDLCGVPWRVAFALQDAGWWLREDVIWSKPNPMPESVRDRCTRAHEYLFHLTRSKRYYHNADAIAEPAAYGEPNAPDRIASPFGQGFTRRAKQWAPPGNEGKGSGSWAYSNVDTNGIEPRDTRNKRSIWQIATEPYPEAHFATFPEALVEPCILASSRVDDVILDPFAGSGTTGAVAKRLGRAFVGLELNPTYIALAQRRIDRAPAYQLPMFVGASA